MNRKITAEELLDFTEGKLYGQKRAEIIADEISRAIWDQYSHPAAPPS